MKDGALANVNLFCPTPDHVPLDHVECPSNAATSKIQNQGLKRLWTLVDNNGLAYMTKTGHRHFMPLSSMVCDVYEDIDESRYHLKKHLLYHH